MKQAARQSVPPKESSMVKLGSEHPLRDGAVEQMLIGVTTRKHLRSLEALPPELSERGVSKSAVSRRFVATTREQLESGLERELATVKLVARMIDCLHFECVPDRCCRSGRSLLPAHPPERIGSMGFGSAAI